MKEASRTPEIFRKLADILRIEYVRIAIFGFAIAALWNSLHTLILPVLVSHFVAESEKTLWLGLLILIGLVLAMVIQPIAGAISDRSGFRWGRRRPFILIGTLLAAAFIFSIGFADGLVAIFVFYCLLQIFSNTAHGPWQGLIPDLVPEEKRGRASGAKGLFEVLGIIVVFRFAVTPLMQRYTATDGDLWLWLALGVLAAVLLVTMIVTVVKVKERPGAGGFKLPPLSTIYKSFRINTKARPNFIPFLVSRLLFLTPLILVRTYGLYYLQDVAGIPAPEAVATVGDLIIVVIVSAVVVVYPAGRLADKIGKRKVTVASGFIGAVGVVPLFFSQSYAAIILAGGILGISYGAFTSANWAMATDLVIKDEEARYLGLTNLASAGSTALVGLLGLVIYLLEVDLPGTGYLAMLVASLIFFIVSSTILLRLKVR